MRGWAWLMVAADEPVADPVPLLDFPSTATPAVLARHGVAVAQRLLGAPLDGAQLRTVLAALGAAAGPDVRQRLLTAELEEVRAGRRPPPERLPGSPVDPLARGDMESLVASAVLLGTDDESAVVLQVAARHGIRPPVGPLVSRLEQLVQRWVDDPRLPLVPERSIWPDELLAALQAEVRQRFDRAHPEDAVPLLQRFGSSLGQEHPLIDEPFEVELFAARASVLPPERVVDLVHAAVTDVRYAKDAVRAGQVLQEALLRWNAVSGPLACELVVALPPEVAPTAELAKLAVRELRARLVRPSADDLEAVHVLQRHFDLKSRQLDALAHDDRWLTAQLNQLRVAGSDRAALAEQVARLNDVNPGVLAARLDKLLVTAVGASSPTTGAAMLAQLPAKPSRRLARLWAEEVGSRPTRRAISWGVGWAASAAVPEDVRAVLQEALTDMIGRLPEPERGQWVEAIGVGLTGDAARVWKDVHSPPASLKERFKGRRNRG